jgi:hypothetical protein
MEKARCTIVQICDDEIELVESDERWSPQLLLLDEQIMEIVTKKIEYWNRYNSEWNRYNATTQRSKIRSIETIFTEPAVAPPLCSSPSCENHLEIETIIVDLTNDEAGLPRKRYSPDDSTSTVHTRTKNWRDEIERTDVLDDAVTRIKMEALLQRFEAATRSDRAASARAGGCPLPDALRRATVGLAGGACSLAGVAMVLCPVLPGGCFLVYAGLLILGTEFEGARRALETVRGLILLDCSDKGRHVSTELLAAA